MRGCEAALLNLHASALVDKQRAPSSDEVSRQDIEFRTRRFLLCWRHVAFRGFVATGRRG